MFTLNMQIKYCYLPIHCCVKKLDNFKARIMAAEGGAIENLYVCGDNAGGFFYNNYPCVMPGIAMGRNMTFAIKAVKMAFGEDE